MTDEVSALEGHIGYWLRIVSNQVTLLFSAKLEAKNITVAEWVLLRSLYDHQSISPHQLAKQMNMTRGAISKLIDRLAEKGHVIREEVLNDRRYQIVSITPQSRQLVIELCRLADQNDSEFFDCLSDKGKEMLKQMLIKLVETHRIKGNATK